jgi:hypothetical protein
MYAVYDAHQGRVVRNRGSSQSKAYNRWDHLGISPNNLQTLFVPAHSAVTIATNEEKNRYSEDHTSFRVFGVWCKKKKKVLANLKQKYA